MTKNILAILLDFVSIVCSANTIENEVNTAEKAEPSIRITKNALKCSILSLGSGSSKFTYERAFTERISAEVTLGRIGWGWDWLNHTQKSVGWMTKAAVKYNFWPQPFCNTSWLAGMYAKPEYMFSDFDYIQPDGTLGHTREHSIMAKWGYQFVFKWFVLDLFAGCGYGWGTGNANDYFHGFLYWKGIQHWSQSAGFRIGVAF